MILDDIVADKRLEIEARKRELPPGEVLDMAAKQPSKLDFASALREEGVRLIAEVKKASPSRGVIRSDFNPVDIALTYAVNGASAISVLTDSKYFQVTFNIRWYKC